MLQGDERFAPMLDGLSRDDGRGVIDGAFHVATAVKMVISDLEGLAQRDSPQRAAIVQEAFDVCLKRTEAVIEKARMDDEPLLPKKKKEDKHFDETEVEEFKAGAIRALEEAKIRVDKAISEGCKAFKACAAMEKLKEAVGDLELKRRYDLNVRTCPDSPPFGALPAAGAAAAAAGGATLAAEPVFDFFGVPPNDPARSVQLATNLKSQWSMHRRYFRAPAAATIVPPAENMAYWRGIKSIAPDLSKYACLALLRPNGNAAPERLMSLLTAMDKPSARSTKAHTLRQTLFLRGNSPIVRKLLHEGALERAMSTERTRRDYADPRGGAGARRLELSMASLLRSAHAAAVPAAAAAKEGEGEGEGDEDGDDKGDSEDEARLSD